ncbi:LacI family DNA-binding transcriptional regulator [Occultella gossypii]|uniref:LacI family DNA-binding transcriptional regulator n=1 Tax=Occultella gossypii TaxID=2800820 RepID=A0ABS7S3P2_9MICO|nr:LacI family DNA-binding transcriptional regulator [Occultella gossypii]MBZ2194961.1 LacI family DNA-binding transcriptional regulator [Occultella gossypii]
MDRDDGRARRPTISDIAALAGVSKASVSKSVNGQSGVSESTRRRVLEVAERLGWRPSARAVALTRGGSGAVGFLINRSPDLLSSDPYFVDLLSGIERALTEQGYWLLLQIGHHATEESERAAYADLAGSQRVDGVFLTETRLGDPRFDTVRALGLPAVVVSKPWARTDLPWVGSANPGGGIEDAVLHLARLGHRKVAYVTGPQDRSHVLYRTEAFLAAVADHGLSVVGMPRTDFSPDAGARATLELLDQRERPSAIVYDNDVMAVAGSQAASGRGLSTPHDLSVVGHDDISMSRWLTPALTTVRQDVIELGQMCARRLLLELGVPDPGDGWQSLPDPTLVVRGSTGPAPTS